VTVPPTINGLQVVEIGAYAFDSAAALTSITIPDGVTSINTYAFQYCSSLASVRVGQGMKSIGFGAFFECRNLTNVTLPDSVTSFDTYAFRGCSSLASLVIPSNLTAIANSVFFEAGLTNVSIPRSVTSIGSGAFHPCAKLQVITVDALNPVYSSLDGVLLNKGQTLLIQCPGGKRGNYSPPQSVVSIGESSFSYCGELTGVTLGTNLTAIPNQAFFSCRKLSDFTIPDRVTAIGTSVFAYCSGLTNVTLGKAVSSVGSRAFASCVQLQGFSVSPLNPNLSSVEGVLFNKSATRLLSYPGGKPGSYTIPASVTNIAANAFESSSKLAGVVIPPSVKSIPDYAFAFCTNLTSVTIPRTVSSLGDRAFVACSGLASVYFSGNTPALLSSYVFYGANKAILYYLSGTLGWTPSFGGRPTMLWNPTPQSGDGSFGVHANRFGFNISGTTNIPVVIEAATTLDSPVWIQLQSCKLTNGSIYFSDPTWTNYPTRFYRIRSP